MRAGSPLAGARIDASEHGETDSVRHSRLQAAHVHI
jgi:hypothetical protein